MLADATLHDISLTTPPMITTTDAYFYRLHDHTGAEHSSASGNNKRQLMRQLKKQMRGMIGIAKADFYIVTEFREGGNKVKLTAQLHKDEEDRIRHQEL